MEIEINTYTKNEYRLCTICEKATFNKKWVLTINNKCICSHCCERIALFAQLDDICDLTCLG